MERYPLTVLDFQDMLPTDDACAQYLALLRWPEGSTVRTAIAVMRGSCVRRSTAAVTVVERAETEPGFDPTPLVHRVASLLKRWLMGTHHGRVEATHLPYYLDEFTFRFNRRTSRSRGKLFYRLVQKALAVPPKPLTALRAA